MNNVLLTAEQAQQIEEALVNLCNSIQLPTSDVKALSTIRAARAQERETVVCESCGETIHECQIAGETESGGVACTGCVVSYLENRASAWENRASAIATAVMTDNQYHDSLLRDRDYLLETLGDIADKRYSRIGCAEVAKEAIVKVTGEKR